MHRAASRRSEASEPDMDGMAESELAKLQRQYRIMEGDRKAYCEESQNIIRKQKAMIEALQAEQTEIKTDLTLAESRQNQIKDGDNTHSLKDLVESKDSYEDLIAEEKQTIAELDAKIRAMERKIKQQHKTMGGVHASHQRHTQTQKMIRVLENRLHKATVEFNDMLTENSSLREEIDHLRTERNVFDNLYKKLSKELNEKKKEMGEIIEQSTSAYDARDEAQAKMMGLKDRSEKDLSQYNMELKELMRIIDHDAKLKQFMTMKTQERAEMQEEEELRGKKKEEEKPVGGEETVETYEAAFTRIKEVTGEEDIDTLVKKFIATEDKNFALFNYVNELNNEVELLQDQIQEIKDEIAKFKAQGIEMEKQRKEIMKDLEAKATSSTQQADQHEAQQKSTNKILEQLKAAVESVFTKINCDRSVITDMLGGSEGVTETNMMQYLGLIEQKTNDLLQMQAFLELKEAEQKGEESARPATTTLAIGPSVPPIPATMLNIAAPSTGDDYESESEEDDNGDYNRPLSQDELKAKVMRSIAKKEQAPKKRASSPTGDKHDKPRPGSKQEKMKKPTKR
ncbi:coiled-coil domain-containing protein 63-like isoform X2 [Branchiostoma floridae x Branchiostoma belcheri]